MNAQDKNTGIIDIHGKQYQTVAYRVNKFREDHASWSLTTAVLHRDEECVVMQATITDEQGRVIANGHAEEYRRASSINKTSALENAETSAIGRALAALGLGGTEFASADELVNALTGKPEAVSQKPNHKSVARETLQSLSGEEQEFLREQAMEVLACLPDELAMWERYAEIKKTLDDTEQVAWWAHFDSKSRAALKRGKELELAGTA